MEKQLKEQHRIESVGWLRAAVLGANDGIISTASLVLGVASAHAAHGSIMLTGMAGLTAGAMSMATGEYVSVHSQADTEQAALEEERVELETDFASEHRELTQIYVGRGLDRPLAKEVAAKLMAHDALGAHARDELGISEVTTAKPLQAALASASSFAVGAVLPLAVTALAPENHLIPFVATAALASLAFLGGLAAKNVLIAALRLPCSALLLANIPMPRSWFLSIRTALYKCLPLLFYPAAVQAAPEEIQVYMNEFADKGKFGLDLHTIYVATTRNIMSQPPLHQLRLTPELSYGFNEHFETAAYFLTNKAAAGNLQTDGVKVRMRWRPIVPTESTVWYAAVNVELGRLAQRFNADASNGEIKGILTRKAGAWAAGLNLNIDRPLRQNAVQPTTMEVNSKLSYDLRDHWQIGLENYSFLGPVHGQVPGIAPNHSTFLVTDFPVSKWDIHLGIGQARGAIPDKVIVKAIIGVPI